MNKIEVSYEITGADLSLYKQTHSYKSGKPDPFDASTSVETPNTNGGTPTTGTNTNTGTTNTNTNTSTNTDPNSTGTFFNNTGLK